MEIRIDHFVIAVSEWERSNAFYGDVCGAEVLELSRGRYAYRFGEQQLKVHGPGSDPYPVARERVRPGNSDLCLVWAGRPRRRSRTSSGTESRSSRARSSGPAHAATAQASTSATRIGSF